MGGLTEALVNQLSGQGNAAGDGRACVSSLRDEARISLEGYVDGFERRAVEICATLPRARHKRADTSHHKRCGKVS